MFVRFTLKLKSRQILVQIPGIEFLENSCGRTEWRGCWSLFAVTLPLRLQNKYISEGREDGDHFPVPEVQPLRATSQMHILAALPRVLLLWSKLTCVATPARCRSTKVPSPPPCCLRSFSISNDEIPMLLILSATKIFYRQVQDSAVPCFMTVTRLTSQFH
jgi:hypothetical protein